jgi:hypothetical protein
MISAVECETWGLRSLDRYFCRKGILRSYNHSPKHDMLAEGCFAADFSCGLFAYYEVFRS